MDAFKEASLVIKARLKTAPIQQWAVGREYRRRLVQAFAAEGIESAGRTLQVGDGGRPLPILLMEAPPGGLPTAVPR